MADLTPEEIDKAISVAKWATHTANPDSAYSVLARAVLALTEQVEKLDDEALKWTAIAGGHAEQIEALTEQRPEPVTDQPTYREDDLATRIAAADAAWCMENREETASPLYVRHIARYLDVFESHPPGEADLIERVKTWLADRFQGTDVYRGKPKVLARHALQLVDEVITPHVAARVEHPAEEAQQ